jgi:hypothetical protein
MRILFIEYAFVDHLFAETIIIYLFCCQDTLARIIQLIFQDFQPTRGNCVTRLTDLSMNGTFVNDALVGKGRHILLSNSDRISIGVHGTQQKMLFLYVEKRSEIGTDMLRQKYFVTDKMLGK